MVIAGTWSTPDSPEPSARRTPSIGTPSDVSTVFVASTPPTKLAEPPALRAGEVGQGLGEVVVGLREQPLDEVGHRRALHGGDRGRPRRARTRVPACPSR